MDPQTDREAQIQCCLDGLRAGDPKALEGLFRLSLDWLKRVCVRLFSRFQRVQAFEQADDLCQIASLRLFQALEGQPPATVDAFFQMAARQVHWALLDLSRHYYGPEGRGRHECSFGAMGRGGPDASAGSGIEPEADTAGPSTLAQWGEFHDLVRALPDVEFQVFSLHYYLGLTLEDVSRLMGLSLSTVKRRWLSLRKTIGTSLPGTPGPTPPGK